MCHRFYYLYYYTACLHGSQLSMFNLNWFENDYILWVSNGCTEFVALLYVYHLSKFLTPACWKYSRICYLWNICSNKTRKYHIKFTKLCLNDYRLVPSLRKYLSWNPAVAKQCLWCMTRAAEHQLRGTDVAGRPRELSPMYAVDTAGAQDHRTTGRTRRERGTPVNHSHTQLHVIHCML